MPWNLLFSSVFRQALLSNAIFAPIIDGPTQHMFSFLGFEFSLHHSDHPFPFFGEPLFGVSISTTMGILDVVNE